MRAFLLLLVFTLFAPIVGAQVSTKILKPGDVVKLSCEEEPSLNKDYTITKDGLLVLSFVGAIPVAGMTEVEAAKRVGEELVAQRIVRTATVTITTQGGSVEQAPIRYRGAVKAAGEVPWREGIRLSDVLKLAEPTESADLTKIRIVSVLDQVIVIDFQQNREPNDPHNPLLKPGDLIVIQLQTVRQEVLVLGGVKVPGSYPLEPDSTIMKLIEKAGGLTSQGDRSRIRLERTGQATQVFGIETIPADTTLLAGDRIVIELRATRDYVYITGGVNKPGGIDFSEGMTLGELVVSAGGVTRLARQDRAMVQRSEGGKTITTTYNLIDIRKGLAPDPVLRPNDRVSIAVSSGKKSNALMIAGAAAIIYFLLGR